MRKKNNTYSLILKGVFFEKNMGKENFTSTTYGRNNNVLDILDRIHAKGRAIGAVYNPKLTPNDPKKIIVYPNEVVDKDKVEAIIDAHASTLIGVGVHRRDVHRIKEDMSRQFHAATAEGQFSFAGRLNTTIRTLKLKNKTL